jgi:hypothetical protein
LIQELALEGFAATVIAEALAVEVDDVRGALAGGRPSTVQRVAVATGNFRPQPARV